MSDFEPGDYVHEKHAKFPGCEVYIIERLCLEPRHKLWGPKPPTPRYPAAICAPLNKRTLTKVPGRKTAIFRLDGLKRLNVLEALARVAKV